MWTSKELKFPPDVERFIDELIAKAALRAMALYGTLIKTLKHYLDAHYPEVVFSRAYFFPNFHYFLGFCTLDPLEGGFPVFEI